MVKWRLMKINSQKRPAKKTTLETIYLVDQWDEGREKPQNLLCTDNRGKFFLAASDAFAVSLPEISDLPASAFLEVDFVEALQWASHASKFSSGGTGGFETLLDEAARRLKSRKP